MSLAEKKPENMSLADLINAICLKANQLNNDLKGYYGQDSKYHTEKELRDHLTEEYKKNIKPFSDEINKRERKYLE
jgi:hypothetical protein